MNEPQGAGLGHGHRMQLTLPPLLAGMSVLVVDDQEANVKLLVQLLERVGLGRILTTMDARDAIPIVETEEPDLVLLDLHMPHIGGIEVLRELRRRTPAADYLPVLVLTADVTSEAKQAALDAGANDFLTKPFDPVEVTLRVRNLLQTRFLHQQLQLQNRSLADEVVSRTAQLQASELARADVVASLGRMAAGASAEDAAQAISGELLLLPEVGAAGVVMFTTDGQAVPLSIVGLSTSPVALDRPLAPAIAAYLLDRANKGPWLEDAIPAPVDDSLKDELRALGVGPSAYVPLRKGRDVIGLLTVATLDPDFGVDRFARVLPVLVDRAAVASAVLAPWLEDRHRRTAVEARIRRTIDAAAFHPVFQPVVDLDRRTVLGYEALTRFDDGTRPDLRFAEAESVGLGTDLELACAAAALEAAPDLPPDCWVSINVSADLLIRPADLAVLIGRSPRPVVLELTEHIAVTDYAPLKAGLERLRAIAQLAIDDAGAGFASFRHILELEPDFVKLDIGLVHALEQDERRQALIAGLRYFANKTGCVLIADGIETVPEEATLHSLEVELGQGFLLGRPGTVEQLRDRRDLERRPFASPAA
jgi:EAL domain-containing protein (putative c-di-GMP-specific phosphodiesterase class I)/DNA-binding NarL/FixJ family response regulator